MEEAGGEQEPEPEVAEESAPTPQPQVVAEEPTSTSQPEVPALTETPMSRGEVYKAM
jgi:translation initiation factor IF-2